MKRCSQKRCCLFYALHLLFVWLGFIATAEMCSNTYLVFVLTAFVSCCRHAQGDWSELRTAPKRSRRQVHRLFWVHIGSRCTCRCCRPSASGAKGAGGTRLECERSWQDLQSRYRFVSVSVFFLVTSPCVWKVTNEPMSNRNIKTVLVLRVWRGLLHVLFIYDIDIGGKAHTMGDNRSLQQLNLSLWTLHQAQNDTFDFTTLTYVHMATILVVCLHFHIIF